MIRGNNINRFLRGCSDHWFSLYLKKAGLASRNIVHLQKYSFYVVSTSASIFLILFVKPIRSLLIQLTPAGSSFRLFALTFYSHLDYISWISLVFMFQEQIWSRDHSKAMALMSTKYKTSFLYHMIYFHPFGTICLAWVLFFWCSLISMLQEQVPTMNTP